MRFRLEHDIEGRMRINLLKGAISLEEADRIQYSLDRLDFVKKVKIYERTGSVAISYIGDRDEMLYTLQKFSPEKADVPEVYLENSGRALDVEYSEKLMNRVLKRYAKKLFMPKLLRGILVWRNASRYAAEAVKSLASGNLDVAVLDGTAIIASLLRGNTSTAGSIMFLLGIGELLEEWTHKKSVSDLARSMALDTSMVWKVEGDQEIQVGSEDVSIGDVIKVYTGNVIPFDGEVLSGEAMVNQSSLTGEPLAVQKKPGITVYAGTSLEEGELLIIVKGESGASKYEQIVQMIEETEKLKSSVESRAEHLADHFVPFSLAGTALVYALTRNATKALSVLMVDYSCALKLSTPITVLSAIKEAREYDINIKGGKFMEAVADADTIVFDKTGTLTEARPDVKEVVSFDGRSEEELLRIAACLEEHFPHSMAKAVVNEAEKRHITHEEMHSEVEYIIAHGIASDIDGERVIIGSYHFVFEDEMAKIPEGKMEVYNQLPEDCSHLYMAINGELAAVILIQDPLRPEAAEVIKALKELGISRTVMMTGDSDRTAKSVAKEVGVDKYYSEVLPEDKARFVEAEQAAGRKVIMIGDGINDSPALSAADCGIAISDGAELARDIADITIGADNLYGILTLKQLSNGLMDRIDSNYRKIMGINSGLIVGGVTGLLQPTASAFLHNASTIGISVAGTRKILQQGGVSRG